MADQAIRLRSRRSARRGRGHRRLLPVLGGSALLLGAALWWQPQISGAGSPPPPQPAPTAVVAPTRPAPVVQPLPTLAPSLPPSGVAPAPLNASGQALLAAVRADLGAQWLKNDAETALRSGPDDQASVFTTLPQWTTLRQLQSKPNWILVQYDGDGETRQPGPGWVKATDVGAIGPPSVWLTSTSATTLWSAPDASAKQTLSLLPPSTVMQVTGLDGLQGSRVHVWLPGDGQQVPPSEGWVDANALSRIPPLDPSQLPVAFPADLHADVRMQVPYRTQLDGSTYAEANCGPTALGMGLQAFGLNIPAADLRQAVLQSENFDPSDDDAGSYIWALARVAQSDGLQALGLYDADGQTLHQWTVDEIRSSVRAGHPVIVQVVYRALPGREWSLYYGDHYVIITGLVGDNFLYNDPIGGPSAHEPPGYDREMTPAQLQRAMQASDRAYANAAFALSKS